MLVNSRMNPSTCKYFIAAQTRMLPASLMKLHTPMLNTEVVHVDHHGIKLTNDLSTLAWISFLRNGDHLIGAHAVNTHHSINSGRWSRDILVSCDHRPELIQYFKVITFISWDYVPFVFLFAVACAACRQI